MDMTLRTLVFTAPSGRLFEIREQNGEDEEIITNPVDSKNLMNLTKYISAIVIKTNATKSGRLTIEDALKLPLLDRYCILFNSRIFSLGEEVEFTYKWDNKDSVTYSQDLREFLSIMQYFLQNKKWKKTQCHSLLPGKKRRRWIYSYAIYRGIELR